MYSNEEEDGKFNYLTYVSFLVYKRKQNADKAKFISERMAKLWNILE